MTELMSAYPTEDLDDPTGTAPSIEVVAAALGPPPARRVGRTGVQVLVAVVAALPGAIKVLTDAGVDVDPKLIMLVLGVPAALTVLVAAGMNAYDQAKGKG